MSITRVQGNSVNSSGSVTSQAVTLGSGITQGNLVVASVTFGVNTATITGPSGWTQDTINQPAGGSATIETSIWYMVVPSGHAGETSWTWSFGSSHTAYICIEEWSVTPAWQANPADKTANGDTSGSPTAATTIVSGTTATTTQPVELWIASLAYKGSAQSETGITSGWTKDLEATLAANNTATMLYQVASSTGAAACQYTIGTAQFWAGCVATFMPALARTIPTTAALQSTLTRTVPSTGALKSTLTRTIPAAGALQGTFTRIIPASASLSGNTRVIPASAALQGTLTRTVPASAALTVTSSRTVPASASLAQSAVFYASNVAQTQGGLTLSDQMSQTSGGTETSYSVTMPGSGTNAYVELLAQGGSSQSFQSLPAPTGKGWSISLAGNTILAGSWYSAFTLAKSGSNISGASLIVRWYRRTMDGTYYTIGISTLNQTLATAKTVYTTPSVSANWPWQFTANDVLYMDAFVFNGSTAWASDVFTVYVSNSASLGVFNDGIIVAPQMETTPAGLNCLIGASSFQTANAGLPVLRESFTLADAIDQRSILTLTGEDVNGTLSYQRGMPVQFSDHDQGVLYTGAVNSDKVSKPAAGGAAQLEHALTFMDPHYLVDKRANTTNYLNWTAGDMVADFIQSTLSQENITGAFALDSDYTPAAFGQGTLSGTVATTTSSPFTHDPNTAQPPTTGNTGDLELVRAGTQFTLTEQATSDFASGTLTNMAAASNMLAPTTQQAICVQAEMPVSLGAVTNLCTIQIWSGSFTVASNDTLNYDIWSCGINPSHVAAVDLGFNDGTTLSGYIAPSNGTLYIYDQNGIITGPITPLAVEQTNGGIITDTVASSTIDLSNFAKDTWYTRTVGLGPVVGKTITSVSISLAGTAAGQYTHYVKNCYLGSQSGSPFFSTSATATNVNPAVVTTAVGYMASSVLVSVVPVFLPQAASRISGAHSISGVGLVQSSTITWTASLPVTNPNGTATPALLAGQTSSAPSPTAPSCIILVSYDGNTWLPCTNNAALPGLPAGANVSGVSLYLQERFSAGTYPTALPSLEQVNITIASAANQTTTDVVANYGTTAQWNTGTEVATAPNANGDLTLSGGVSRDWSNHLTTNQTFFPVFSGGSPAATQSAASGAYVITTTSPFAGLSRFDFAGTVDNFTLECDLTVSTSSMFAGVVYRTQGWSIYDNNFGYMLRFSTTLCVLSVGSNSSTATATGTNTNLAEATVSLTVGTAFHVKLVVNGARHQVYLNHSGTATLDFYDTHILAAGGVGFWAQSSSGAQTGTIDNFTVNSGLIGTWTSPSISLNALGTCGNTQIAWSELGVNGAAASTAIVQTSIDGGTTYQQCQVNGGTIPLLPSGTSVTGKSLLVQIILFASASSLATIIQGLNVRVCGSYGTVTGTRISPALPLSSVGYVASSNCMWNANIPTNTTLTVATSQDASTWTNVGNNGAGAALGYWSNQPAATQDLFNTNTSANYTSTHKSGGSNTNATWTYDTPNSRITATSGVGALYLYSSGGTMVDMDMLVDMDESDAGGLCWRVVDTSNYYELVVCDASSSSGSTNVLQLNKVAGGTRTLLGSAPSITFTRTTFHRIRVTMQGGLINVYFDGQCVQSYLDTSPLGAGQCGLRHNGGVSRYYQLWIQALGTNLTGQTLYTKVTMTTTDPSVMPQLFTLVACIRGPSIATGATISQLHPITTPFASYYSNEMDALVQSSGDFYWYVDKWRQMHFGPRLARPGAFPIQSIADPANVNATNTYYSGSLLYQPQVTVLSSADLFRSEQIVTNVTGLVTPPPEVKVADGSTTSWTLGYPVYSAPTITVNRQSTTVGVQGIDNNRQFYWQPGSASISYDSSLPKLPSGAILNITYVGQSTVNVVLDNGTTQAAQAAIELNSGIVAEIESAMRSGTNGMTTAQATTFGNGLLSRYGNNGTIEVIGSTLYHGLAPGTVIPVFLNEVMSTWNAQLPLIKVTTTGYLGTNGIVYVTSLDATNGPNLSNWARVWGLGGTL